MKITEQEVTYIAKLANLVFSESETKVLADEFTAILSHFDQISQENLEGLEMVDLHEKAMKLRQDEVVVFEDREALYQNVKVMRETAICIPKVVE